MNSDISHASDCVFYDSELKSFKQKFKEINQILKDIDKRAQRRQTIQISKSLFDYIETVKTKEHCPQILYDFRDDFVRICPYRVKGRFSVLVVGFDYPFVPLFNCEFSGVGLFYGDFDKLDDCLVLYRKIVYYYLLNVVCVDKFL